jgi:hypothetical protein
MTNDDHPADHSLSVLQQVLTQGYKHNQQVLTMRQQKLRHRSLTSLEK